MSNTQSSMFLVIFTVGISLQICAESELVKCSSQNAVAFSLVHPFNHVSVSCQMIYTYSLK